MTRNEITGLRKTIDKYLKSINVKPNDKDVIRTLRNISNLYAEVGKHIPIRENYEKDNEWSELHEKIVQNIIDFINKRNDIQNNIEKIRNEIEIIWNEGIDKSSQCYIIPDVQCHFCIDNLDESIKYNKWTAATDSLLNLTVGDRCVVESV